VKQVEDRNQIKIDYKHSKQLEKRIEGKRITEMSEIHEEVNED
jgi:hypothetical protein